MELLEVVGEVIAICESSPRYVGWAGYWDQDELLEDSPDRARLTPCRRHQQVARFACAVPAYGSCLRAVAGPRYR